MMCKDFYLSPHIINIEQVAQIIRDDYDYKVEIEDLECGFKRISIISFDDYDEDFYWNIAIAIGNLIDDRIVKGE